jgi:hypothetical protein
MNPYSSRLHALIDALNGLRVRGQWTVLATDIIREWMGAYLVDIGISVGRSPNAALGRFIADHAGKLGLVRLGTNRSAYDDRRPRRRTRCVLWGL